MSVSIAPPEYVNNRTKVGRVSPTGRAKSSRRSRRAALLWHAHYCAEVHEVGFEEAHAVLACLAGLSGRRPKPAAAALASLVHRRGLERASEALNRWAD